MGIERWEAVGKRVFPWSIPLVALSMLAVMLVPAEVWHRPTNDAVYQGFDPNLISASRKGDAPSEGIVHVSPQSLKLTALPNSQPTVHLVTSPLSFRAAMNVRILESGEATIPFSIGIWSARTASGYFLNFGPSPDHLVTARTVVDGAVAQNLIGGTVTRSETLGRYVPGHLYHLEMALDKRAGVIYSFLSGREAPPLGGAMIRLVGGPADPAYREVISKPVSIEAGRVYRFGGLVKLVTGADSYKIVVQWLDMDQKFLGFANDWRSVRELQGWTKREFLASAPPKAAFARLFLGSGNGTQLLFANLFLRETGSLGINLLPNGDLQKSAEGWEIVGKPSRAPEILDPHPVFLESSVTVEKAPILFESLRLSLTASASSQAGIASTVLEDYSLTLPHQRWQVVKTDDVRTRHLVTALLLVGMLLCVLGVGLWGRSMRQAAAAGKAFPSFSMPGESLTIRLSSGSVGLLSLLFAYVVLNALLFHLGSLPFDMTAAKVWSYVGARHGPLALYHLPNTVSLAKVWGGAPYHEAVFPYHPVVAYYVTVIGWVYRTFLSGPGPLLLDTFSLEFLIKSFNVVFGLADAALIYLILRELKLPQRSALAAGVLFLFNPAIWFSMSVWGQNHVVTLFPLLLSIWMAERRHTVPAWLALVAGALTRPQMLVPAFLLGMVYLRKFSVRENVYAISWSIIIAFLFLAPFSLAISPSAWVDILLNQLRVQEAGGNEPAMTIVSLDAYNIWLLVTRLASAATGLARFHVPSSSALIGALTYQQVSQILVLIVILGMGLGLLVRRRAAAEPGEYLLPLALGTMGFLVLKTGLAASHFIIGLPFLILCRKPVGNVAFYSMVGIWTATTFASMYGSLGFAIWDVAYLAPALHDTNNAVTRFFMNLHSADWFITLGATANIAAVVGLAFATISASRRREAQAR